MAWLPCFGSLRPTYACLVSSLLLLLTDLCMSEIISPPHLVYSTTSRIAASNFTYFKLHKTGRIKIVLNSIDGDADLYISSSTLYPTYNSYELKSATCGEDVAEILSDMKRPLGIGVFGHPLIDETTFELQVFAYDDEGDNEAGDLADNGEDGKKDSVLWTIFVNILKIIIDVLV
ncbi:hypothetical protein HELRODRAFT_191003 [Helobdella robusta]|uniref:Uncharacterized protein n=1 Tax=Helobdella robusta TaxID=6412 RepID=T1FSH6_HELRO|nr:hypothetical protein HELRODRAFT_191003 [Helobdella robusta]ESO07656.1 hypothetical protein HELRODRAFT_191003 [Helobdella robusta]